MKTLRPLLKAALFAALCVSSAYATTHSQKTFLSPRPIGVNMPMEYTTWHEHVYRKSVGGNKVHSKIQVTPFYQASLNKKDIGNYFGTGSGTNSFTVVDTTNIADVKTGDICGDYLIHNSVADKPYGKISFDPKQEVFGARMDYFQDLFKGIFFKASLPIVQVKNNMGMKIDTTTGVIPDGTATTYTLTDFFKGGINVSLATSKDMQSPLDHAKIDGSRTATGVADIDLALGYKLYQSDKNHVYLNIGVTVPTGKESSGEYLFEPLYGNGHHFGLGGQFDAGIELWHGKKASARVLLGLNYRYLFEDTENRTVGIKNVSATTFAGFNHYYLMGVKDQAAKTALFPAANVLTQGLKVKPGSMFDAMFDLSFKCSGFVVDLGYNLFYKDKESTSLKNAWTDDKYAVAITTFDTQGKFDTPASNYLCSKCVNSDALDLDAVTNPSQLSHKIFGGLGYNCNIAKKYPVLIGIGGDYAFASENSTLETWAAWLKAGISF